MTHDIDAALLSEARIVAADLIFFGSYFVFDPVRRVPAHRRADHRRDTGVGRRVVVDDRLIAQRPAYPASGVPSSFRCPVVQSTPRPTMSR
jgi:hypothetical protein